MKAIILAAGQGSRLGVTQPKSLTRLCDDRSILEHQIDGLTKHLDIHDIYVVVGFKKEMIMEAIPYVAFIYNERFHVTNTSKSLIAGLRKLRGYDVIWINGDVVMEREVISRVAEFAGSCAAVNRSAVGTEEVKYRLADDGTIAAISKTVTNAMGEAVGVNKIGKDHLATMVDCLEQCAESDFFERAMEMARDRGVSFHPVDISDLVCVEIDNPADLERANRLMMKANVSDS